MAAQAVGKGGRSWSDSLLGRPWLLVAAVALLVALPVLVIGQASENETRARLKASQVDAAMRTADQISTATHDRWLRIIDSFEAQSFKPAPDTSPVGSALRRMDGQALQALTDTMQRTFVTNVSRIYVVASAPGDLNGGAIVAASPATSGLVGTSLSHVNGPSGDVARRISGNGFPDSAVSGEFEDPATGASGVVLASSFLRSSVTTTRDYLGAMFLEIDVPRLFSEVALPALRPGDDALLVSSAGHVVARARPDTTTSYRDLSADPIVLLALSGQVINENFADPYDGGHKLLASASGNAISAGDLKVLVLQSTAGIDADLDSTLGQLATARYVLAAVLVIGAIVIAQATSAQVRQRRALAEANARVEAASLHKSAFLSSMSHELRTPLNSINGFSDVLLAGIGGTLTEKQREYLMDIRGSGDHLLALVNDVLDLSKVEAGKMELQPTEFDLGEAVEGVQRVVAPLAQQKGQRLELAMSEVGTVRLDQARLRQVLLNVLSNAVKYTPDGGSITTMVQRRDGSVEITVRDTGVGIAPEDQARVFDDFTRIESGYAHTQQGTGLGLALARRLVRLMGGDITLVSEPGQGSTFTITVPAA